jgi:TM2 domain-containing membrane protein YozV
MPPIIAALCSLFVPGLGQLFRGQIAKGLVLILVWLALGAALHRTLGNVCGVGIFNVIIALDAYLIARSKGRVRPWQWFG